MSDSDLHRLLSAAHAEALRVGDSPLYADQLASRLPGIVHAVEQAGQLSEDARKRIRDALGTAERVLRAVEQIPRGQVASYGDIAGLVGIGPRQVGSIMRAYGGNVTWWRVTNASGDLPVQLMDEVRERWAAEGILLKPNGRGCRIAQHRADLTVLSADHERAIADLRG